MTNRGRKKIGFIIDDAPPSGQAADLLRCLLQIEGLDVTLIQNVFEGDNKFGLKRKLIEYGPVSFFNKSFFKFFTTIEEKFSGQGSNSDTDISSLPTNDQIFISPLPSKRNLFCRYTDHDIRKITNQKFDLIVRGDGRGIYKGDILNSADDGFLSIHYGDNRIFRGIPPGFWEIYFRHSETGFIIQLLNEVLDGGMVITRGASPTKRNFTLNWLSVRSEAHKSFKSIMTDYANNKGLPKVEKSATTMGKIYTTPNIWQVFNYIRKLFT